MSTILRKLVKSVVPPSPSNQTNTKQQKDKNSTKCKTVLKTECKESRRRIQSNRQGQGKQHRKDITKYQNQFFL